METPNPLKSGPQTNIMLLLFFYGSKQSYSLSEFKGRGKNAFLCKESCDHSVYLKFVLKTEKEIYRLVFHQKTLKPSKSHELTSLKPLVIG